MLFKIIQKFFAIKFTRSHINTDAYHELQIGVKILPPTQADYGK